MSAAYNGLDVVSLTPVPLEDSPGNIVNLRFSISTQSQNSMTLIETLDLPTGWNSIMPPLELLMQSGEKQIRIFPVRIPENALAGEYEITYLVRGRDDPSLEWQEQLRVIVLPESELQLLLGDVPKTVIAGDNYTIDCTLVNRGNTEIGVDVFAVSEQD